MLRMDFRSPPCPVHLSLALTLGGLLRPASSNSASAADRVSPFAAAYASIYRSLRDAPADRRITPRNGSLEGEICFNNGDEATFIPRP
jgi:hypothetical protein